MFTLFVVQDIDYYASTRCNQLSLYFSHDNFPGLRLPLTLVIPQCCTFSYITLYDLPTTM